ncbi:MAG TPA: putative O-glycosylation ligase, exosortase A system-associated, partial [Sphingorhabdus sp.]|nr:putative O-glycosylation ligase, exosortase A system-associated [Sphingorhabdus sp.]
DAYRINKIRYDLPVVDENGFDTGAVDRKEIVDQGRAYHSSYFEMLGEQGFPGLIIWLLIHVGGVWRMEMIARMYKKRDRPDEQWVAPLATALQNAQIIYLVGSLFVGIAFQPFVYMLVAMQLGLDTYLARRRNEAAWTPIRKQRLKAKEISATT